jgi:hypothetical protein
MWGLENGSRLKSQNRFAVLERSCADVVKNLVKRWWLTGA